MALDHPLTAPNFRDYKSSSTFPAHLVIYKPRYIHRFSTHVLSSCSVLLSTDIMSLLTAPTGSLEDQPHSNLLSLPLEIKTQIYNKVLKTCPLHA
jgi:hypothetical protein